MAVVRVLLQRHRSSQLDDAKWTRMLQRVRLGYPDTSGRLSSRYPGSALTLSAEF